MQPIQTFGSGGFVNLPQVFQTVLLANVGDAVIATDKNFTVLTWNKAAENIYGIPASLAIGAAAREIFNYTYLNSTREDALAELVKNQQWKGVVRFKRNDHREIILDATVTEIISDSGELLGYVAVNRDITEESELRLRMESFLTCFSQVNEAIVFIDRKLKVKYANAKAHKIMKAIGGQNFAMDEDFASQFPPERQGLITEYLLCAFEGEASSYETNYEKGSDNRLYLDVRYCPLKNEYGEISYVCIVVKNITKQKREQLLVEELSKSRKLFETFMDNSRLIAWIATAAGTMHYMNRSYLKKFRITGSYAGKSLEELFPLKVAAAYRHKNEKTLQQGSTTEAIEEVVLPDGSTRLFKVIRFPVIAGEEQMVGGWAADISDDAAVLEQMKKQRNV